MSNGILMVISGPAGSGKGTLAQDVYGPAAEFHGAGVYRSRHRL